MQQLSHVKGKDLLHLQPGDILSIDNIDHKVDGVLRFNDHGWHWVEYKLKEGLNTLWLSVEQDDELEISLYQEVVALTVDPPKVYEYKGITYYLQEGSDAIIAEVMGNINVVKGEEIDYYEYCDETGKKLLSIEIWDGECEMSTGKWLQDYNIEIYPNN